MDIYIYISKLRKDWRCLRLDSEDRRDGKCLKLIPKVMRDGRDGSRIKRSGENMNILSKLRCPSTLVQAIGGFCLERG